MQRYAVNRAYFYALRCFEVSDTFGAQVRIYFINFHTRINCIVRTLGFAHVAIDAFVGDHQCHINFSETAILSVVELIIACFLVSQSIFVVYPGAEIRIHLH